MLTGSMVALVTPMQKDLSVDYDALSHLIDFHVREGSDALVIAGTTGESATLEMSEHCELLRRAKDLIDGRVPMIAGTGANSTREAIELTRCAAEIGADAALLVTPYYNKPTQKGLLLHHTAIADAVDIAQILYNVPGRTACDMQASTAAELSRHPRIIGIKEATGDLNRLAEIQALVTEDFILLSGDDASGMEFMLQGGHGVISVTANVAPARMSRLCRHARAGERELAEEIDQSLQGLHHNLFLESSPIPVKWAMAEMGLMQPWIRLPLTEFDPAHHANLRQSMLEAGSL